MTTPTPTMPTFDPRMQRPVQPDHMCVCVNAVDVPVSFEVGGTPGSPPTVWTLPPGASCALPKTLVRPIRGAGRDPRESILFMLTSMEAYPGGPRIQAVVPEADAEATAKKWAEAKASRPTVATVMLTDAASGAQVPLAVPLPQAAEKRGGKG